MTPGGSVSSEADEATTAAATITAKPRPQPTPKRKREMLPGHRIKKPRILSTNDSFTSCIASMFKLKVQHKKTQRDKYVYFKKIMKLILEDDSPNSD